VASSSSNAAAVKMVNNTTPEISDYWKKSTVIEANRSSYHIASWLGSGLVSLIPTVEVPTVENSTIVCFELHHVVGLALPPNKFLVAIMNFLMCELIHLNPNAIAAVNCFAMLYECWLGIALDMSLF
jgi:hypothetical protein